MLSRQIARRIIEAVEWLGESVMALVWWIGDRR
jgi:hypothetical protein